MDLKNMSIYAITHELGERIRQARLNRNLTQAELADKTGLSIKAIVNTEKGKSKLDTFVAVLVALDIAEQLNLFLPVQEISPIQLAKLKGKKRQRASKSSPKTVATNEGSEQW